MFFKILIPVFVLIACSNGDSTSINPSQGKILDKDLSLHPIDSLFNSYKNRKGTSKSIGTVNNGRLENGIPFPFLGKNFHYFDTISYLQKRAFVHEKVYQLVLATYDSLYSINPSYRFGLMECSNENGGKIWPHKTHQNGLSVDFMSPLLIQGLQSETYDYIGSQHYFMEFDEHGTYTVDPSHSIDFETIARHLEILKYLAPKYGLKVNKVILKLNLKDELFATKTGKKLQNEIYFAQHLSNLINNLHDDHYHVDFELIK